MAAGPVCSDERSDPPPGPSLASGVRGAHVAAHLPSLRLPPKGGRDQVLEAAGWGVER